MTERQLSTIIGSGVSLFTGTAAGDSVGNDVSLAGDINGDGFQDFVIGSSSDTSSTGRIYVVFGGAAGFPAMLDLGTLDGTNGFSITGAATSDLFGRSIDYGDFNGDGLDDLIVGADPSDTATEGSFVVFGSTASFASTFSVSALDGANGFEILGPSLAVADDLGFLVSSAGDFNGDGIEDFAVSAPYVTPASGVTQAGSTFIVFGTTASPGASLSVNALTGSNGIELNGDTFVDVLGVALENIGDINGDGIDDFAAGSFGELISGNAPGEVHIILGNPTAFPNQATIDTYAAFSVTAAPDIGANFGRVVEGIGDVNGDGIDDFAMGASLADGAAGVQAGAVYVIFGSVGGLPTGQIAISAIDGTNGFVVEGAGAGDRFGHSISGLGDYNGDGIDDFVIGTPYLDGTAGTATGAVYIVYGQTSFAANFSVSSLDGTNGLFFTGDAGDKIGEAVSGGDFNNDGAADILVSAEGRDTAALNAGGAFLIMGDVNGPPFVSEAVLATFTENIVSRAEKSNFSGFPPNDFTIDFFVQIDTQNTRDFFVSYATASSTNEFLIGADGDQLAVTLNGAAELFFPASAINDGAVHHVAVTYDATTGDLAGYLDGELLGVLAAGPGRNFGDGGFLVLGEEQDLIGGGFDATQGLIGGLGQVNLWRRTLTEAEVDEAFAGDVNAADPDLAAAYRFNPSTNVFDDITGGGNDLTSSGGISARAGVGVDATVEEEATLAFRSLFVGDVDALNGSGELTVAVSAANGVVELRTIAGLTITAGENNSASLTVQGAAADINAALARLDYRSDKDFVGADTITILVDDGLLAPRIDFAGATTATANVTYALDFDTGQVTTENQFGATTPPTNGVVIVLNPNPTDFEVLAEVYENGALTIASTDFTLDGYLGTSGPTLGGQRFRFDDAFSNLTLTWSQPDVPSPTGPREVTFTFENISFADDGVNDEVTFSSGVVNSGAPARDEAVINLTVANVNDAPTAQDDALATDNNATLSGDLFADNGSGVDVDPDGDAITVTQIDGVAVTNGETVTLGSGALLTINADGSFTYDPNGQFDDLTGISSTEDTFTYQVTDGGTVNGAGTFPPILTLDGGSVFDGITNGTAFRGVDAGDEAGFSVTGIGDINADGFDDLAIGAIGGEGGAGSNGGEVYVVFGTDQGLGGSFTQSGLDGTNGFRLDGVADADQAGFSVSDAGDVNGDGIDDFIIGARLFDADGQQNSGAAYVVFGTLDGFNATVDLGALDGTDGFRLDGAALNDNAGYSVSGGGDFNGDGLSDILVGARDADDGGNVNAGRSYIVFGSNAGFAADIDLATLSGSDGFRIDGVEAASFSARSLDFAGDVNGDGYDDIIIGAYRATADGDADAGASYVVFGYASGFSSFLELSSLDGTNGFRIDGTDVDDRSGFSVSAAGDFNGDGIADLILGAPLGDVGVESDAGESYVVFGTNAGFGADLDLSAIDGTNGVRFDGVDLGDRSGSAVSGIGDVNNDGIDDIAIGAPLADFDAVGDGGETYVVFGSTDPFAANFDLTTLDGTEGFTLRGTANADQSGGAVSGVGDFNGDGVDDFIIGARYADPLGVTSAGESYLVFGQSATVASTGEATATVTVSAANADPVAQDDSFTTDEDSPVSGSLFANNGNGVDTDAEGDVFTVTQINGAAVTSGEVITLASGALLTIFGTGTFDYDPNGAFETLAEGVAATDTFTYTIDDGAGASTATVTININGLNDAPLAQDDAFTTPEEGGVSGNLFSDNGGGADSDPDSAFTVSAINGAAITDGETVALPSGLAVTVGFDGSITFDTQGNFEALGAGETSQVTFTYTITDSGTVATPGSFAATLDLAALDGSDGFRLDGVGAADYSGTSVSSAGDVNGDGIDDIIIGADFADPAGGSAAGETYVVFGTDAGFAASFDLSTLNGTNGFRIDGVDAQDRSGHAVSAAGDVNGDGVDDLIIGAFQADANGASDAGETYVVFGDMGGFGATLDLSSLNGANGFLLNGVNTGDQSGRAVSSAGDVNADGIDDLIIGAALSDSAGVSDAGTSYVVFGANAFPTSFDLASLDGSNGFRLEGIDAADNSGGSVSGAGDFNGDGIDDLIIGARKGDAGSSDTGETYVVFGTSAGFSASFDLSTLDGTNGVRFNGINASDYSGRSVSYAGDVNADGIDDIIIGAPSADGGSTDTGAAYIVFGSNAGFGANVGLNTLNGSNGFAILGNATGDNAGFEVSGVGDVNADGIDDILVSARLADPGGNSAAGESYVIFGSDTGFAASIFATPASLNGDVGFVVEGIDAGDQSGRSVSGAGDVNGDGVADLIIGASFANGATGESYVVFGRAGTAPATSDATVTVTINGSNDAPAAQDDAFAADEDSAVSGSLFANNGAGVDSDADGDVFTVTEINGVAVASGEVVTLPSGARLTIFETGTFSYDPAGAFDTLADGVNGADSFTYTVDDGNGGTASATASFTIAGRNDAPIAQDDAVSTDEDTAFSGSLFADNGSGADADVDGPFTVAQINGATVTDGEVVSLASGALLTINADGTFDYDPNGQFEALTDGGQATDTFTYQITDGGTVSGAGAFGASVDLSALDGTDGFALRGVLAGGNLGNAVASAGDVNGDGIDDLIVGAYRLTNPGETNVGEAYVIYGVDGPGGASFAATFDVSPAALDGTNGFTLDGIDPADLLGFNVSGAGDVNGDGIDDLIVSAPFADPGGDSEAGESYVVFGGASLGASIDLSALDGTNGFILDGIDPIDQSGNWVSDAGDFNGDGLGDIIIGARRGDPGGVANAGESYVVFGSTAGFTARVDLSALNGADGFTINGSDAEDQTALVVDNAGDVNGDGIDDIIVSGHYADPEGEAYVIFGTTAGFGATFDLSSLNGANGFLIEGDTGDGMGRAVSSAGDVNGDGIDDLIVAARSASPGGRAQAGEVVIVFGTDAGFGATLNLSTINGTNGFTIEGETAGDFLGISVSDIGDVNNDGIDDLIVGTQDADPNGANSGAAYVVFGSASGFGATLSVASLDGTNGFQLDGLAAGDQLGRAVSGAGDVNGDGVADLIVGARYADAGGVFNAGEAYVVFGQATAAPATSDATVTVTINGANDAPVAQDDVFAADEDTGFSGDLFADNGSGADTDVEGAFTLTQIDGVSVSDGQVVQLASGALLTINADGTFTYAPNGEFKDTGAAGATDTFTYTIDDGAGGADTAAATISISAVNDAPIALTEPLATFTASTGDHTIKSGFTGFTPGDISVDFLMQLDASNAVDHFVSYAVPTDSNHLLVRTQNDEIAFGIDGEGVAFTPAPVDDGGIHHIALTYEAATGIVSLYVDGDLHDTGALSPGLSLEDGGTLVFGEDQDSLGGGFQASQGLIGGLGQVNLWNRVLTEGEVETALAGGTNVADPDLAAAYRFNPGTNVFEDATGNGNDMTTVGAITARAGPAVGATGDEDTPIAIPGLALFDVDGAAGTGEISAALSVTNGTITLGAVTGLTFDAGANGAAAFTIRGAAADVNAALATLSYQGGADFNGADTLSLAFDDLGDTGAGGALTGSTSVAITVNAVNDPPVAQDDAFATDEDRALSGDLFADNGAGVDSDVDSAFTVSQIDGSALNDGDTVTLGSGALLTINADGTFTYDPNGQFEGLADSATASDSFTYTIDDGAGGTDTATANLTITGVNDAPIARDDALATDEDSVLAGDLFADNGSGVDSDADTAFSVTGIDGAAVSDGQTVTLVSGATLLINADGTFSYDPNGQFETLAAGATATEAFTYTIDDGGDDLALNASAALTVPNAGTFFVVDFDTSETSVAPRVGGAALPSPLPTNGLVIQINPNNANWVATATLIVDDVAAEQDPASFSLANYAGTTNFSGNSIVYNDAVSNGVLTFASAVETPTGARDVSFTFSGVGFVDASPGDLTLTSSDVTIGNAATATATVTITGVNDAPVPQDDAIATDEDTPVTGNLFADNGSGPDSDADSAFAVTEVEGAAVTDGETVALSSGATLLINADGSFTYDPNGQFETLAVGETATDTFTYTIDDGGPDAVEAVSGPRTVPNFAAYFIIDFDTGETSVENNVDGTPPFEPAVNPTNGVVIFINPNNNNFGADARSFVDGVQTLRAGDEFSIANYGGGITVGATGISFADAATNAQLTWAGAVETPTGVRDVSFVFDGINFADASPGDLTLSSVTATVSSAATATATVTVTGVNDAPIAADVAAAADEDGPAITVAADFTDVDASDTHTFTIDASGALGSVTNNGDGTFSYDATGAFEALAASETATDSFTYTVNDGQGGTSTATVNVTVTGANDAPVAADDAFATDEDTSISGDLFADNGAGVDSDVDDGFTVSQINGAAVSDGQVVTLASGALLTIGADGTFDYDPNGQFEGTGAAGATDSFTYTIEDGAGGTDTAVAAIAISAVNDAPTISAPQQGGAAQFGGTNATAVTVPHEAALSPSSWSVEAWVTTSDAVGVNRIVTKPVGGGQTYSLLILDGEAHIRFDGGGGEFIQTGFVADGQPHHLAGVFDNVGDTLTLYIDGAAVGSLSTTKTPVQGTQDLQIGRFSPAFSEGFDGEISEVRVWSDARSGGEIAANFDQRLAGDEANLELYLTFDGTFEDQSVNGRDGAAVGTVPFVAGQAPVDEPFIVVEDQPATLSGVSIADVDAGAGAVQLTVSVANGLLAFTDLGGASQITSPAQDAVITLEGQVAQLNTALASLSYISDANFNGTETLTISVDDLGLTGAGGALTATETVAFTVQQVDDAPVAQDDAFATDEDTVLSGDLFADNGAGADADVDSTFVVTEINGAVVSDGEVVILSSGALLTINADGTFAYDPNGQFETLAVGATGTDSFTYTVQDPDGGSDTAAVNLTITGVNDPPVAGDDVFATDEDTAFSGDLFSGAGADTDIDGVFAVSQINGAAVTDGEVVTLPSGALLTINADGTFDYDPNGQFEATGGANDTFAYTIDDGAGGTDSATVTIAIAARNDAPVITAPAQAFTAQEDLPADLGGVTIADVDAAAGTGEAMVTLNVGDGTLSLGDATGLTVAGAGTDTLVLTGLIADLNAALATLTYLGDPDFNGAEMLSISVNDLGNTGAPGALTDVEVITFTVAAVNDAPVAADDAFTLAEDTPISGDLFADNGLGADIDVDSVFSVSEINGASVVDGEVVSLASGALLTISLDGGFTYDPNGAFDALASATDSFTYQIDDGAGGVDTATVNLTINGVNDPPVAQDDAIAALEDTPISGDLFADNGAGADSDVDGGFTVTAINGSGVADGETLTLASGALLTINVDGTFDYDPNGQFEALAAGATATDGFTYTINDGAGGFDAATVTLTIDGANDAPVAIADAIAAQEDTAISGDLFADNGAGADGDVDGGFTVTAIEGDAVTDGEVVTLSSGALVTIGLDGTFVYDPNGQFEGLAAGGSATDSFTYSISDGAGGASTATVNLTVAGAADAPLVTVGPAGGGTLTSPLDTAALTGEDGFVITTPSSVSLATGPGRGGVSFGDLNDDGFADVVFGARTTTIGAQTSAGQVHVVFGGADFDPTLDVAEIDGTNGFSIDGLATNDFLGDTVNANFDFNGDGIDDLITFASGSDLYGNNKGAYYVIFGGQDFSNGFDLGAVDGTNGFIIHGVTRGDRGQDLATDGDVNGDGIDDLVFLDMYDFSNSDGGSASLHGTAYVLFGGTDPAPSNIDISTSADIVIKNVRAGGAGGIGFVEFAGDVNNDGFDDIVIGSQGSPGGPVDGAGIGTIGNVGDAALIFGGASVSSPVDVQTLDGTNGFRLIPNPDDVAFNDVFASGVGGVGDINDDGFDDFAVSIRRDGDMGVVFGGASFDPVFDLTAIDGTNGVVINGGLNLPVSIADAGDVNSDGVDDLIITGFGAPGSVILGDPDLPAVINPADDNFISLTGGAFQSTIAGNADVNGDGVADFAASNANPGEIFVVFGTGPTPQEDTPFALPLTVEAVDAGAAIDVLITGLPSGLTFNLGAPDGPDWLISGAEALDLSTLIFTPPENFSGDFALSFDVTSTSGAGTISTTVTRAVSVAPVADAPLVSIGGGGGTLPAVIDPAALDGSNGFLVIDSPTDGFGSAQGRDAASLGDINGDGFADIVVGARVSAPEGRDLAGQLHVIFGGPDLGASIDTDNLDGTNGFTIDGLASIDLLGEVVAADGDLNGDGINDIVVHAAGGDLGGTNRGTYFVIFGGQNFGPSFDLNTLDGTNGFTITGLTRGDRGQDMNIVGDVNGDGIDDLAIGDSYAAADPGFGHKAYIFFGSSTPGAASLDVAQDADVTLTNIRTGGPGGAAFVNAAGDVNGDGFDDIVFSNPYSTVGTFAEAGDAGVLFGGSALPSLIDVQALDGTDGFRLEPGIENQDFTRIFGFGVGALGDLNNDGFDDVGFARLSESDIVVLFGGTTFDAVIDPKTLGEEDLIEIEGGVSIVSRSRFGPAGDVNSDGIDDAIVGLVGGGVAAIILGSEDLQSVIQVGDPNVIPFIPGQSNPSVAGNADVNGDGVADVFATHQSLGQGFLVFGVTASPEEDTPFALPISVELADADGSETITAITLAGLPTGFEISDGANSLVSDGATAIDLTGFTLADIVVTPSPGFNGAVALTLTATSAETATQETATTIEESDLQFAAVNDAPVAVDDGFATDEETAFAGDLLADNGSGVDADPDGDPLSITQIDGAAIADGQTVTLSSGALLTISAGGAFTYDPNGQFEALGLGETATDLFSYTVADGLGGEDQANVTILIDGINDAPAAADDVFETDEKSAFTGDLFSDNGVGADGDVDGDPFTLTAVGGATISDGETISLASGALLTISADGVFDYDPNGQFDGLGAGETATDAFSYSIDDGAGGTDTATATILISGVNDAPFAAEDVFETDEESAFSGDLLADNGVGPDGDVDGAQLVVSAIGGQDLTSGETIALASGALLMLGEGGAFVYDPNGQFEGLGAGETATETFTYTIDDGDGGTDSAMATIIVSGVNDGPEAEGDAFATDEETVVEGDLFADNGAGADSDADGAFTVTAINGAAINDGETVTLGTGALLTINADGTFAYDPNGRFNALGANQSLNEVFEYTISDGSGGADTATATITIAGVNDAPSARDDVFRTDEDTALGSLFLFLDNGFGPDEDVDTGLPLAGGAPGLGGDPDAFRVTAINGEAVEAGQQVTLPSGALLLIAEGGGVQYDPNGAFEDLEDGQRAVDTFLYQITDNAGGVAEATARIEIDGVSDVILGSNDNDVINATAGDDAVAARGGNDVIAGFAGNDTIDGGAGNDRARGGAGSDELRGGDGNDVMFGESGDDTLVGGDGDDRLRGQRGEDVLIGGEGNDVLAGARGNDSLNGGVGKDTLAGGGGDDSLSGGNGRDKLGGSRGADSLFGGEGGDRLSGGGGDDTLIGGRGDDTLVGGRDDDVFRFRGETGSDKIRGFGTGDDVLDVQTLVDGFGDLTITQVDQDAVITSDSLNVTLIRFDAGDLTEDDFLF